jgi:hypothetical protein
MDLARSYAGAWFQDRWTILGRRLRPMTIGHGLVLARLNNFWTPFSVRQDSPTRLDLVQGLYVCSRCWRRAVAGLQRRGTGLIWRYWDWCLRICGSAHELVALAGWNQYYSDQLSTPRLWIKPDSSGKSKAPILAVVAGFCMRRCGATLHDVLDCEIRPALWHMAAYADATGSVELYDPADDAWLAAANQADPTPET